MKEVLVNKDMTIAEIMELKPFATDILLDWGLSCAMCSLGSVETFSEGAQAHGFSEDEISEIIDEINSYEE